MKNHIRQTPWCTRSVSLPVRSAVGRLLLALMSVGVWSLAAPQWAVAQPGWSGVVTDLSQPSTAARDLEIAIDPEGNATAVWRQAVDLSGHLQSVVHAARFTPATGVWTAPSGISAPDSVAGVKVATDAARNVLVVWARSEVLEAARYSGAQGTWSATHRLSAPGSLVFPGAVRVAMDPAGNGIALWSTSTVVQAARYNAATVSWEPPVDVGPVSLLPFLDLVVDSAGDAVAVFNRVGLLHASQYRASTGTWSSPTPVSAVGTIASDVRLAADDQGNTMAVWIRGGTDALGVIEAARFVKNSGTWTAPVALSLSGSISPNIAVDRSGNAFVTWLRQNPSPDLDVEAIRYSAAGDSWSSVVTLATGRNLYTGAPVATDGAGNAITVWGHGGPSELQFARYTVATSAWSPTANVPGVPLNVWDPDIRFDAGGNAVALWAHWVEVVQQQATRWVAGTPEAPTITGVAPGPGTLAVHVALPALPAFPATNLEYSLDDGRTWTARMPPSTASPVAIDGLTDFSAYTLRVRGSNAEGVGVPSPAIAATAGPVPGPPVGLTAAAIAGNTVTLAWTPPPGGTTPPTAYVLEGGVFPGQVLASIPTGSLAPTFTLVAPTGAFFIRMHAVSGAVRSAPSNEVRIFVAAPAGPSAPASLLGLVNESNLTLSWINTFGGGPPSSLWLSVTGAITTVLPLPMGDTFSYAGVPPGTYTLSVAASNAIGVSPFSNPVTLAFPAPCSGVPGMPVNFQAWRIGTTIVVSWNPPTSGPAVTNYTVQVSGAYVGSFSTSGRTLSGVAAPGSYGLRVAAGNACGAGPPTPVQTVVVP